jgi:chemotaxis protein methyltransferase CheR
MIANDIMNQPQVANRESPLERLRPLVEAETGMDLSGTRFQRLQDAAQKVLTLHKPAVDLDRILDRPRQRAVFLEELTAELTVGESFFFRNEYHFQALREHVIPHIFGKNSGRREIRIWVAGCATGEEPYSLAILLDQLRRSEDGATGRHQRPVGDEHVSILATDLNAEFLERARAGRFREWSFRRTDIHNNRDYFRREGREYCLHKRIRDHVRFTYLNLVKDVYPSPLTGTLGLDLILFRNVAIYLKAEVTKAIIRRFHRALRPGGWLLLGETEVQTAPREGFQVHRFREATLFQKELGPGPVSDDPVPLPEPALAAIVSRPSWPRSRAAAGAETAAAPTGLPDWVPLPKAAKVSPPVETTSTEDQIHRCVQQQSFGDAERIIERIPGRRDRATSRLQYVRGLLASGAATHARTMLDKCLVEEPLLIEAQLLKATFDEEDGDLAGAERAYRRALYVDRTCAIAHFHLGLVQKQRGDRPGARNSLQIAAKLARGEDVHEAVPHGDGVCYGRLLEMIDGISDCQLPSSE